MFEGRKINKLLEKFSAAGNKPDDHQIISDLKRYGKIAVLKTLDAFQHKRLNPLQAQLLLDKLCDETHLEIIVPLIGDPYDAVRRLAKEMIFKRWPRSAPALLTPLLKNPDIYSRTNAGELLIQLHDKTSETTLISMFHSSGDVDLKKNILKILSNVGGNAGKKLIINALFDNSTQVQLRAAQCLSHTKAPEALDSLLKKLDDNTPQMRMFAIDALRHIGDHRAARPMLDLLKDNDLLIRQKATETLIEIADSEIVPEIISLMKDCDVDVRRCAVEVLKQMKDPNTSDALMKAIKDADWWVRQIATDSLTGFTGGNIVSGFIKLLADPVEDVRRCAVEFFLQAPDPEAFDALVKTLNDSDWWVREKTANALGKLQDKRAIKPLMRLLDDQQINRAVPTALGDIGGLEVRQPLLECLFYDAQRVRLAAIHALEKLNTPDAVTDLQQCLADPDEEIRNATVQALKTMTGKIFKAVAEQGGPPLTGPRRKIPADTTVTEAIVVIDLCNSTDITSRYGDSFAMQLMQRLSDVVNPTAKRENYQFIKGTGDGFLITFPKAENAVRFSLASLNGVQKLNAQQTDESKKINLRFAINFGEARIDETGDRLGAAVSMTFRVEGLKPEQLIPAENGMTKEEMPPANRILITENIEKELGQFPGISTKLVGLFELKGITGLHRIYHLTDQVE